MEWAQPEDSEVSGGRSEVSLIQIMDIIMLVQVVGLHTESYASVNYAIYMKERIVSEGGSFLTCITGDLRNGSGQQWGVRWVEDTLDILADEQWFTTLDLVKRYWQVS